MAFLNVPQGHWQIWQQMKKVAWKSWWHVESKPW
uniref:Uncharacterized protein n=1 Tax=Rhizophora mucronata TaxID=61149 RepID=A0A2P2PVI5_RHIMU